MNQRQTNRDRDFGEKFVVTIVDDGEFAGLAGAVLLAGGLGKTHGWISERTMVSAGGPEPQAQAGRSFGFFAGGGGGGGVLFFIFFFFFVLNFFFFFFFLFFGFFFFFLFGFFFFFFPKFFFFCFFFLFFFFPPRPPPRVAFIPVPFGATPFPIRGRASKPFAPACEFSLLRRRPDAVDVILLVASSARFWRALAK